MEESVKTLRQQRRGLGGALVAVAAGVLAISALMPAGATARTTTHDKASATSCASVARGPSRIGHIGISKALKKGCSVHNTGDPNSFGQPPLLFHGGPAMGTPTTSPVVITPVYWNPSGHPISGAYKKVINKYIRDVQTQSGKHTNVYSTLNEYFGSNGQISYSIKRGPIVNDTNPLPANGCTLGAADASGIYADNSGYNACLDDSQIVAELENVRTGLGMPADYANIYVMFMPKHVESCFNPGSSTTNNFCTINHYPTAAYCAYHGQNTATGMVYANMPFPIYQSSTGFSCTDEGLGGGIQAPNGNVDADVEISPTSHEVMEAITDPDVNTGWYDAQGYENGDECAYVYGTLQGTPGAFYNQVIDHRHYLTQEEPSNQEFATTGKPCLQFK
jgi:hypothetical protein